jgi:hypothetical protein
LNIMQKRLRKISQKILLIITILGLVGGTFSTATISHHTASSLPTENLHDETESTVTEDYNIQFTVSFSKDDLSFDTLFGYDLVTMKECSYLNEIGKPMIPTKNIIIALPKAMKATHVRILSIQEQPLDGTYNLLPTQRSLPIGQISDLLLSIRPCKGTYTSPLPYPLQLVSLGKQTDLAGQSMIPVTIFPLQYLPLQKKLALIQSIQIVIEGVEGYACRDYLPQTISENGRLIYEQMIQEMVINPENVQLRTSPGPQPMGVPPGDYDYVIITQSSWYSAFQSLADWKTQKGIPATIVNTTWIYNSGGYSGTNVEKIRAFVQDAYTTWGTTYVLLGGDIDVVPCHYRTISSVDPDPIPNDAYYADFDSDWLCEVSIGRASVTGTGNSTGQIGNFIYKVLTYEKNPPLTNYAMNAAFFGFNLDGSTPAEQCKITIKNTFIPAAWTMTAVYDSHTGNHKTNVISAINAGQNLLNHADHSNSDYMGTGYVNHNWGLGNSDMDALTNGNKQAILYSMGCDPAAYDTSNCIAEHFVRNSNGGGIAFIGNSRYGWYNTGSYNTLSMEYDVRFFRSIFQEGLYNLGAAFSDHKNDVMQSHSGSDIYQYIFTELTLLGDPELPVWTENPSALVVTHPLNIPLNSSSFTVTVKTTGGSNVASAYVCIWKRNEIYQQGLTSSAGTITFTISPATEGGMNVTVTKHNYIPSKTITYATGSNVPPYQPNTPTPANTTTNVSLAADLSWNGGDPNPGNIVTYDVYFGTTAAPPRVINNQSGKTYDPGTMNYITTYYWRIIAWDNYGASTAGPLWRFTTKVNSPPVLGTPLPTNGSAGNPLNFIWGIPINDPEGNTFSWSIQCSNGQVTSGAGAWNGTKSLALLGLAYSIYYKVWVNASDPAGSGIYTRRWYTFTTVANQPPEFGLPTPANGSFSNPLSLIWIIPINDPEGDLFSWSIQCSNGQVTNGSSASNGTKSLALSNLSYSKTYKVWVNATDLTGSGTYIRGWYTFNTGDDVTPPVTTIAFNGTLGNNGWYISALIVILTATDTQSGVDHIYYKIDSGAWSEYASPFTLTEDGSHEVSYYAVDTTGNIETTKTAEIHIDQSLPEITLAKQQIDLLTVKFTAQVSDEPSGIDRVEFSLDGQPQITDMQSPYEWTYSGIGDHQVTATVFDMAGNSKSQSMSTPYTVTLMKQSVQQQVQGFLIKQQTLQ